MQSTRLHAEAFDRFNCLRATLTLDKKRTSYHKARRSKQRCFFVVRRDHLSPGKPHSSVNCTESSYFCNSILKKSVDFRNFFLTRALARELNDAVSAPS